MRAGCTAAEAAFAVPILASLLTAQQDARSQATVVVSQASAVVHLDGRLDEPFWLTADSISDFRQREPAEGEPVTEATVIKLAQDGKALYIAVRAYDRQPRAIRASQLRRDADLTVDDNITLLLDGLRDLRGAFLFRSNPNGAMWDAQLNGFEDVNENWNGIWEVAASRDSTGWTAEFRIPFSTLRFRRGSTSLGFNASRFIRRKNEEVLWRSYGRTEGLLQLLHEGEIDGLVGLGGGRPLELRPYALARADAREHDLSGAALGGGDVSAKAGLDAKLAVSPTLTADLTANTDFAQVEADSEAINLTRFPLFFPEKREFFLESSGIFDFGTAERAQLFYSRRIGLREGEPVAILGGARLYGKAGPWTVGALDARTGRGDEANSLVLRVKHDLLARSYVGAIAMDRSGPGVAAGAERAFGFDVDLPLIVGGQNLEPSFWIAGTRVPGIAGTPVAWRVATDYPNDLFDNFVSLYRIESGFSPTLGFVRRTGIWETTGHLDIMPRPGVLGIRQLDLLFPIPSWDIIADETSSLLRSSTWQTATFEWRPLGGTFQSGATFEMNVQRFLDAPTDSFEIFHGVSIAPGRYWWTRGELQYFSPPGRTLSGGSVVSFGDFYDGRSTEVTLTGTWRGGGHVILGASMTRSSVRLPLSRFTAEQASGRFEYAFNPRTDFLAFVQYNNEAQRVDFNLRFHWIPVIGDDVFVVWNSGYTTDPLAVHRFPDLGALGRPLNGGVVVKIVHRLVT